MYVPAKLRKEVIHQCHDPRTAGHLYYWKTVKKVKRYFNWGALNTDVQVYCQACQTCGAQKTAGQRQAEMLRYEMSFPMKETAIYLNGPFPESKDGNRYVLVVVDSFFQVDGGVCHY